MQRLKLIGSATVRLLVLVFLLPSMAHAADLLGYLTDKDGRYIGPSVEDNIVLMDTDKNGFVDVFEVRVYLERLHGKGYEKDLLDKMEAAAKGQSCGTPFAKPIYQ